MSDLIQLDNFIDQIDLPWGEQFTVKGYRAIMQVVEVNPTTIVAADVLGEIYKFPRKYKK